MTRASLPIGDYQRPQTMIRTDSGLVVRVFAEDARVRETDFRFHTFGLSEELTEVFAAGFARATGPGGTRKTLESAKSLYSAARRFARRLREHPSPPSRAAQLAPGHIAELRLQHSRTATGELHSIRLILRGEPDLTPEFTRALFSPMNKPHEQGKVVAYSPSEFRRIRRAARRTMRAAIRRIDDLEVEIADWRRDEVERSGYPPSRAALLAQMATTGQVPRNDAGRPHDPPGPDTAAALIRALFPTTQELGALAILLICETGLNLSTVYNLPADYMRADDQVSEQPVALVRASKPRRGRYAGQMDLAFTTSHDSGPGFGSAYGVYLLAQKFTARARSICGSDRLLCGYNPRWHQDHGALRPISTFPLSDWTGYDNEGNVVTGVDSRRLRRTYLQMHERPVAQSQRTLVDTYLRREPTVIAASQLVVQESFDDEVSRIRTTNRLQLLTPEDRLRATADPAAVAAEFGIDEHQLAGVLTGALDTVATACVDSEHSPYSSHDSQCSASFLLCLGCPNARAEPRHAPVQALLLQRIEAERTLIPVDEWERRFGTATAQLTDLLRRQGSAGRRAGADEPRLIALVDDLVSGRLELR